MEPREWKAGWIEEFKQARRRRKAQRGHAAIIVAIWIAGIYCLWLYLSDQYTQYQRNTGDGVPTGTTDHHSDVSTPPNTISPSK
jgi:hypothetical protein